MGHYSDRRRTLPIMHHAMPCHATHHYSTDTTTTLTPVHLHNDTQALATWLSKPCVGNSSSCSSGGLASARQRQPARSNPPFVVAPSPPRRPPPHLATLPSHRPPQKPHPSLRPCRTCRSWRPRQVPVICTRRRLWCLVLGPATPLPM